MECDETFPTRERDGVVEHKHPGFDYWHPIGVAHCEYSAIDSIDMADTLLAIDEAIAELVSAKSILDRVGKDSDHVQQAKFEQFTSAIGEVVAVLLEISMYTEEEMDAARNAKTLVIEKVKTK